MSTYHALKDRARDVAEITAAISSAQLRSDGYRDVYDFLMSDDSDNRHYSFLVEITTIFSVCERKILLNGLAREYDGAENWLAFIDRDKRHADRESRRHTPN